MAAAGSLQTASLFNFAHAAVPDVLRALISPGGAEAWKDSCHVAEVLDALLYIYACGLLHMALQGCGQA